MKKHLLTITLTLLCIYSKAQYSTPNTGVNWTLDDLATASPETLSIENGAYLLHQDLIVKENDSLRIQGSEILKIAADVEVEVEGYFKSDGSDITITAMDIANPFKGFWFYDTAEVYFNNTLVEYGGGLKVVTPDFEMYNSEVSNNISGSSTGGAISFSNGSPIVKFSIFTNNEKPALSSPANGEVSAWIEGNYFEGNHTANGNAPQINMGPSGPNDSIRIINNMVIGNRDLTRVGGISASSLMGVANLISIKGNVVRDNRYGITSVGTSSGIIDGNIIEDNDTEGDPMLGGSGINLYSTNLVYLKNNQMRRNLWGVTLQGTAQVNLGSDDEEDFNPGLNVFSENGNGGVVYALYNNTANPVKALHNCWIEGQESTPEDVENVIYHKLDDDTLGEVSFDPFECGVEMGLTDLSNPSFSIYPNPTKNSFFIETIEKGNLKIYDLNGKLIQSKNNILGKTNIIVKLPKGIYLLQFDINGRTTTQKLVVQ